MAVVDGGDVFDRALVRSETQLAAVRRARAVLGAVRWAQVVFSAVALVAVVVLVVGMDRPGNSHGAKIVVALSVAAAGVAIILVAQAVFVVRLRQHVALRERAMLGEIDPLRELFVHIAQREGWDGERVRATRRRLSQFPIEGEAFR